ncbi:hypothetical protein H4R18_005806 [Coemansia javaensis]|uniref:RRM domain-containing protein n=1 Tax=Coemansia javaensis TaxID=2761396 RepID=A0A9W8LEA0_9FUNG|nr:hypothetical protein H4R18_005806 [Coemansia javaensis]
MSKGNPILPSEPLSLQPDLIAAAVLAEGGESGGGGSGGSGRPMSPRSESRARHRMDIRNYGRSASRGDDHRSDRHGERSPSPRGGGRWHGARGDGRSHSPRYQDHHRSPTPNGRPAYRRDSRPRDPPEQPAASESNPYRRQGEPMPSRVLGIFGMSKFTDERGLQDLFGRYGPVDKIQIIRDPHEGRSRGFGFINMENIADAQRARDALNGTSIDDRRVRVDFSFTNRAHSPTPGKYKGQDTSTLGPRGGGGGGGRRRSRDGGPLRPRRRANSRDRRRRDQPYDAPRSRSRSRSRSPGYDSRRHADSYRGSAAGPRRRDYDDRSPRRHYDRDRALPYDSRRPAATSRDRNQSYDNRRAATSRDRNPAPFDARRSRSRSRDRSQPYDNRRNDYRSY